MLLNDLRSHIKWGSANGFIYLTLVFQFLGETKVSNFDLEFNFIQVNCFIVFFPLFFGHCQNPITLSRKMEHHILKFEISVNYQNVHHVIEAIYQLMHYLLDAWGWNIVLAELHYVFKVTSVTKLHEYIVSGISFDSFFKSHYIITGYWVLIWDFTNNETFLCLTQIFSFNNFACIIFWVCNFLELIDRLLSKYLVVWNIIFAVLVLSTAL